MFLVGGLNCFLLPVFCLVLFLSNWLLESIQNMLPDSKYFPGDTVFFPRHLPVQALFAPPPTVLHPVVIAGCWAGPRFRPTARSA